MKTEETESPDSPDPEHPHLNASVIRLSAPGSPDFDFSVARSKKKVFQSARKIKTEEDSVIVLSDNEEEERSAAADAYEDMDLDEDNAVEVDAELESVMSGLLQLDYEEEEEDQSDSEFAVHPFEITIRSNSVGERITVESEDVLRARAVAALSASAGVASTSGNTATRSFSPVVPVSWSIVRTISWQWNF